LKRVAAGIGVESPQGVMRAKLLAKERPAEATFAKLVLPHYTRGLETESP